MSSFFLDKHSRAAPINIGGFPDACRLYAHNHLGWALDQSVVTDVHYVHHHDLGPFGAVLDANRITPYWVERKPGSRPTELIRIANERIDEGPPDMVVLVASDDDLAQLAECLRKGGLRVLVPYIDERYSHDGSDRRVVVSRRLVRAATDSPMLVNLLEDAALADSSLDLAEPYFVTPVSLPRTRRRTRAGSQTGAV